MTEIYNTIIDNMIDQIGGKEYCLQQLLPESVHLNFIKEYSKKCREHVLDIIKNQFYENILFDSSCIQNVDINSVVWNKHLMKIYFYDNKNYLFFEYNIKTNTVVNVSLFEDDDYQVYHKSFFVKLRNGNALWTQYTNNIEYEKHQKYIEKVKKNEEFFIEKMKDFKFLNIDEIDLTDKMIKTRFPDDKNRYIDNNIYYYKCNDIDGYITFNSTEDTFLNRDFSKLFYDKVLVKAREEDKEVIAKKDEEDIIKKDEEDIIEKN
jgi:hypothetical protein